MCIFIRHGAQVLSNENGTPIEVFFDDFTVTHTSTDVVQKDDYYPFGLTFNGYTSGTENLFKFQGQEHIDDFGLNWYGFKWRNNQADLGRFFNVDPFDQFATPYVSMGNIPIFLVDPDGRYSKFGAFWRRTFAKITGQDPSAIYETGGEYGYNTSDVNGTINYHVGKFGENKQTVKEYKPNFFARTFSGFNDLPAYQEFTAKFIYGIVDDAYVSFGQMGKERYHLDGSGVWPKEVEEAGVNTIITVNPMTTISLGIPSKTVNGGQFNKLHKGTGITSFKKGIVKKYNDLIRYYNKFLEDAVPFMNTKGVKDTYSKTKEE